ncbi:MAG: helix-turn-helix domain-containing protein [Phycisphaeraceae bacterium]|nr:helix-turn-helix domain-containing protein [Phycisphaeraceae bacterium]
MVLGGFLGYTKKEVASWLRICIRSVERLIAAGELVPVRVRGKVFITVESFEAYRDRLYRGSR